MLKIYFRYLHKKSPQVLKTMPPKPNKRITRADRNRIIGQLQAGNSQTQVAAAIGVRQATVSKIKRKFDETGSVDDRARGGRPRKTTAGQDRLIVRAVKKDPEITGEEIKKGLGLKNVSSRLVRRRIYENSEIKSYWKIKKAYINEPNRKIRVKWAKVHKDWTPAQWRRVLYSDESPFVLRFGKRSRVWRTFNQRYLPWATKATVKHDKKINVWDVLRRTGSGSSAASKVNVFFHVIMS